MEISNRIGVTGIAQGATSPIENKPLAWPLAAAVIVGLSVGLWVLAFRLLGAIFGF